jgi:hypothetical protein
MMNVLTAAHKATEASRQPERRRLPKVKKQTPHSATTTENTQQRQANKQEQKKEIEDS